MCALPSSQLRAVSCHRVGPWVECKQVANMWPVEDLSLLTSSHLTNLLPSSSLGCTCEVLPLLPEPPLMLDLDVIVCATVPLALDIIIACLQGDCSTTGVAEKMMMMIGAEGEDG